MLSILEKCFEIFVSYLDKLKKSSQFFELIMQDGLSFIIHLGFYCMVVLSSINLGDCGGLVGLFLCYMNFHVLCIELAWGTGPAKNLTLPKKIDRVNVET